ncbi:MOSC domain-containing protein YiiM [Paenibacillus sp. UNC496MF]|uniref:MOSC domain-containing protein n=1 Tax=Paenibacillus sp. UNC496MF TaxID=1502753 RepID=UPI0008EC4AB6|nr:MOSC domain-containing protein [Paenibacillus sp. UNC496MF]SFI32899.1 MOSC domain-containing protein YiiM [Paenibacillus sp. UNC496MF]
MELGTLLSLNVSLLETVPFGNKEVVTGINKKPFAGALRLGAAGLTGDAQGDLVFHGGPDKAVCVYSAVHFPYWTERWGRPAGAGDFGENFTVSALTETSLCIGDVVEAGGALLQVSQPRQPCYKLGMKHGLPSLQLDVQESGYTGFYFRVLEEGDVAQGDRLVLRHRSDAGVTVAEANRVMHRDQKDRDGIARLLALPELSESWRQTLAKRLAKLDGAPA